MGQSDLVGLFFKFSFVPKQISVQMTQFHEVFQFYSPNLQDTIPPPTFRNFACLGATITAAQEYGRQNLLFFCFPSPAENLVSC